MWCLRPAYPASIGAAAAWLKLAPLSEANVNHPAGTEALVLRYLAAFGPASPKDAQTWCGLTGLRDAFERLRPRLAVFADESGRELFDLPDAPRPDPAVGAPVRFLPEWDNLLRSHDDRARFLTEEHREALKRPNDVVPGTVLVDGRVAATWGVERAKGGARLDVEPLRPLSKRDAASVAAEGRRLTRWLDRYTQTA